MTEHTPLQRAYLYARRNLRHTPARALECARADVSANRTRYPAGPRGDGGGGNWERPEDMARHSTKADRAYYCDAFPLARVGDVAEVMRAAGYSRHDYGGWYMDNESGSMNGTATGVVLRLPGRRGFVAGVEFSESDGVTCWPNEWHAAPEDAARAANNRAERIAEKERDYSEARRNGQECAEMESDAAAIRSDILAATADVRAMRRAVAASEVEPGLLARLCARVRQDVRRNLAEMYEIREKRDSIWDAWHRADGFGDGYGEPV